MVTPNPFCLRKRQNWTIFFESDVCLVIIFIGPRRGRVFTAAATRQYGVFEMVGFKVLKQRLSYPSGHAMTFEPVWYLSSLLISPQAFVQ